MKRIHWLFFVLLAALVITGCDSSDSGGEGNESDASGDANTNPDGTTGTDSSGMTGEAAHGLNETPFDASCQYSGFKSLVEGAVLSGGGAQATPDHFYFTRSDSAAPFDQLEVRTWVSYGFPEEPGSHELATPPNDNYRDCALCLRAFTNCTDLPSPGDPTGANCEKVFYADQGTVEIQDLGGAAGKNFKGRLQNVIFKEVEEDPRDPAAEGTLLREVEGGERWCIGDMAFEQEILDLNADACMREDLACVDEVANSYQVQSCATGEMVTLEQLAEGKTDLWMVATAGWCTACKARVPGMLEFYEQEKENGLGFALIVGEDNSGQAPDVAFCKSYQESSYPGADLSLFYVDPNFEATFSSIWLYPDAQGSFGLPWQTVLEGATLRVLFTNGADVGLIEEFTNEALRTLFMQGGL